MNILLSPFLAPANQIAQSLGPMLIAGDEGEYPLACAQANYNVLLPGWCKGHVHPDHREAGLEAYYRDTTTGRHGWMCCTCRKTTQTG